MVWFSTAHLLWFTRCLLVYFCSAAYSQALREQGHAVRLMPAQYVKPYVKTNKSDYLDAEAIAEAVRSSGGPDDAHRAMVPEYGA